VRCEGGQWIGSRGGFSNKGYFQLFRRSQAGIVLTEDANRLEKESSNAKCFLFRPFKLTFSSFFLSYIFRG